MVLTLSGLLKLEMEPSIELSEDEVENFIFDF